jgi:acyl carrier protein
MTSTLTDADVARIERSGLRPLTAEQGLELFDAACALGEPQVLAAELNTSVLRAQARDGLLPRVLAGLVRVPATRRAVEGGSLVSRLAALPAPEREAMLLAVVRAQIAAVLGHATPAMIDPERAFKDLGFDSLAAVELRNRLSNATALTLPATLAFDYPTAASLTANLLARLSRDGVGGGSIEADLDRLEAQLLALADDQSAKQIAARLQDFVALLDSRTRSAGSADGLDVQQTIESASDDELFEFLEQKLGGGPQ